MKQCLIYNKYKIYVYIWRYASDPYVDRVHHMLKHIVLQIFTYAMFTDEVKYASWLQVSYTDILHDNKSKEQELNPFNDVWRIHRRSQFITV